MMKRWIFALLAGLSLALPAAAATYYVAPIGATISGTPDGSEAAPFPSTDAALRSNKIVGGDTVLLMNGVHGRLYIAQSFTTPVTFKSQNGRMARVQSILVGPPGKNVIIEDLKVWPDNPYAPAGDSVYTMAGTSDIELNRLDVRSGEDAYNYLDWTAQEWLARKNFAVSLLGTRIKLTQSVVTGVYWGIFVDGPDIEVLGNLVDGFAGDGMRGLNQNDTFRDNVIQNCFQVDDNHADGFQSYSSGTISGMTLERNRVLEWTHAPGHPLRCSLQGIALFDRYFENIRIVNNVVAVSHYHGISVVGGRRAEIINNTVVNIDGLQNGRPWIGVFPANTGEPASEVLVANNISMVYSGVTDKVNKVFFMNNRIVRAVSYAFPAWKSFDYTPRPDSRFIDTALTAYAPDIDVLRHERPADDLPDIGAYEAGQTSADLALSPEVMTPPSPISAEADAAEAAAFSGTSKTTAKSSGGAKFVTAP